MIDQSLSALIHYEYFYKDAPLDKIKEGLYEALYIKRYSPNNVYINVLRNASICNRLDVLEFAFEQKDMKLDKEELKDILTYAFMTRRFPAIEFLINQDVEVNLNDGSLTLALSDCGVDLLEKIHKKGYDIYNPKYNLLYSSFSQYPPLYDVMEHLLEKGAKFADIRSNIYRHVFSVNCPENIEKINYVLSHGIDINDNDSEMVKWAIRSEMVEMAEHVITCGANLFPTEKSLFQYCAGNEDTSMFELLIKHGVHLDCYNDEIIKDAAKYGSLNNVKYLIGKGFNIEVAKNFGSPEIKEWIIEQEHNNLQELLPAKTTLKQKNKI